MGEAVLRFGWALMALGAVAVAAGWLLPPETETVYESASRIVNIQVSKEIPLLPSLLDRLALIVTGAGLFVGGAVLVAGEREKRRA